MESDNNAVASTVDMTIFDQCGYTARREADKLVAHVEAAQAAAAFYRRMAVAVKLALNERMSGGPEDMAVRDAIVKASNRRIAKWEEIDDEVDAEAFKTVLADVERTFERRKEKEAK